MCLTLFWPSSAHLRIEISSDGHMQMFLWDQNSAVRCRVSVRSQLMRVWTSQENPYTIYLWVAWTIGFGVEMQSEIELFLHPIVRFAVVNCSFFQNQKKHKTYLWILSFRMIIPLRTMISCCFRGKKPPAEAAGSDSWQLRVARAVDAISWLSACVWSILDFVQMLETA